MRLYRRAAHLAVLGQTRGVERPVAEPDGELGPGGAAGGVGDGGLDRGEGELCG